MSTATCGTREPARRGPGRSLRASARAIARGSAWPDQSAYDDLDEAVRPLAPMPAHVRAFGMRSVLERILPARGIYFAATPSLSGHGFEHCSCTSIDELVAKLLQLDDQHRDVYFACASYSRESYTATDGTIRRRTQENAAYVRSFWIDIDVGETKVKDGKGYPTLEAARTALSAFLDATGLPRPLVIASGGGLHCYWCLTTAINKALWIAVATALKRLMAAANPPLLADPTRTADITSILRPPGTHNRKPGRGGPEVRVLDNAAVIPFEKFKLLVDATVVSQFAPSAGNAGGNTTSPTTSRSLPQLTLEELEGALRHIDADCARDEWWRVIAAVVDAYGEGGRSVLRRWSSGELRDKSISSYDEPEFTRQFDDALKRVGRQGKAVTMGSVIAKARQGGWTDPRTHIDVPDWVVRLNDEYAWIEKQASIYRFRYRDFIQPTDFRTQYNNQAVDCGSGEKRRLVPMGTAWLRHVGRRHHQELVIRPGEGLVTDDNCINQWSGFAVAPIMGPVKPFLRLLLRLVPDRAARRYVLKWMAHLIQRPAVKMHVSLAFWSQAQGVGKNLLFEVIQTLIGPDHATLITQSDLVGAFNGWARRRVFVIGDEVVSDDKRLNADRLKGLITGTTLRVNEKYQPAVEVPNLLNFVFLSNHNDALFLDDHDRRYFVWEIQAAPLDPATATAFVKWRDGGGIAAVRNFLEHLDTAGFDPKAPAMLTAAKRQMIEDSRSDLEVWLTDLMASNVAQVLGREVATSSELAQRYADDTSRSPPAAKTVVGTIKKLGGHARPNQVRLATGRKVRAVAVSRPGYWEQQPESSWANELAKPLKL